VKFSKLQGLLKGVSPKKIMRLLDQRGSASVEFSILAIPLFIPLFIFIGQFAHASDSQDSLRTLARESVRAFVSSSDDQIAYYVANQVVVKGGKLLGQENIRVQITCSTSPCISPDAQVIVQLTSSNPGSSPFQVSAIEYVSPWA
jgi:Flp pilus assembly protein TadG